MGRYVATINNYYAEYGDYQWDYIKDRQDLSYYENYFFDIEITNLNDNSIKQLKVPLLEFTDVKKYRSKYGIKNNDKKTLFRWLFKYVQATLNEKIVIYPYVTGNYSLMRYDEKNIIIDKYYLQTEIGDENVILGIKPKEIIIKDFDDIIWLNKRLIGFTSTL